MTLPNETATFSSCRFNFFDVILIPNSRYYNENRQKDYSGLTGLTGLSDVADAEAEAASGHTRYRRR